MVNDGLRLRRRTRSLPGLCPGPLRRVAATASAGLLICAFAVTGASPATAAPPRPSPLQRSVDAAVKAGSVGYVARVDDGRRVTTAVAGLADRETARRLSPTDQFEIGSNTRRSWPRSPSNSSPRAS